MLSIGYSARVYVMAHESFEDQETADFKFSFHQHKGEGKNTV